MKARTIILVTLLNGLVVSQSMASAGKSVAIAVAPEATELEHYAAAELRRYVYAATGVLSEQGVSGPSLTRDGFILDRIGHHPLIDRLIAEGKLSIKEDEPGTQGYRLKTLTIDGHEALVIAARDEVGVLYAVYGLLEGHFGVSFHLDGDVLPTNTAGGLAGSPLQKRRDGPKDLEGGACDAGALVLPGLRSHERRLREFTLQCCRGGLVQATEREQWTMNKVWLNKIVVMYGY